MGLHSQMVFVIEFTVEEGVQLVDRVTAIAPDTWERTGRKGGLGRRPETGQGAEGFITDATSGTLCRDATTQFRARDYAGGIAYIAASVADRYAAEFGVTLDGEPRAERPVVRREPQPSTGLPPKFVFSDSSFTTLTSGLAGALEREMDSRSWRC